MSAGEPREAGFRTERMYTYYHILDCLRALLHQLERGEANLTIDPVVWENTTTAFETWTQELASGRMRGLWTVTPEDVERVRHLRVLGHEALAGRPPPSELLPLIKQSLIPMYGPDWELLPDWETSLAIHRKANQTAAIPGEDPYKAFERIDWLVAAHMCGGGYIHELAEAIERGDADLPVGLSAWENTMAALDAAVLDHVHGRAQWTHEIVMLQDAERVRHLRVLGAEALSGGPRSPEIGPLAKVTLRMLFGPDWKSLMPDVVAGALAIRNG